MKNKGNRINDYLDDYKQELRVNNRHIVVVEEEIEQIIRKTLQTTNQKMIKRPSV